MADAILTFDSIYENFMNGSYKENEKDFKDKLYDYVNTKTFVFKSAIIKEPTKWLGKILMAIEIGMMIDKDIFIEFRNHWKQLLNKDWVVSLEDKWIVWKD